MNDMPPLLQRTWVPDDETTAAMLAAMEDGSWSLYHGPHSVRLEQALRELLAIDHVYPCCSGTFAVELALRMLKVGPGDEVILAGYDFAGNFRAIEAVGATPVLVDIVPGRWHLDPEQLAAAAGPQVKGVLVSHLHGMLAPMPRIMESAHGQGWGVVEDACQMHGGMISGRAAGTWGDVGVFSFGGTKLLTAGRGGAVVTRDATLLQRAKVFCEQGNHAYPLSELQAAVLVPQVLRLKERNSQRRRAAERIVGQIFLSAAAQEVFLADKNVCPTGDAPAYYKLGWWLRDVSLRDRLIVALQMADLPIDAGFRGFTRRSRARIVGDLAHARHAAEATLLMHHPAMLADDETLDRIVERILGVLQNL